MNKLIVFGLLLCVVAGVFAAPKPEPQRSAVAESKLEADLEAGDSEKDDLKGSASYGYGYYGGYGGLGGYYGGGYYPYHGGYGGYPYYSYGLGYPYYGGYGLHGHYY